jgi:hypothetical protein
MLLSEYRGSFPVVVLGRITGDPYLVNENFIVIDSMGDENSIKHTPCGYAIASDSYVVDWFENECSLAGLVAWKPLQHNPELKICNCPSLLNGHSNECAYYHG